MYAHQFSIQTILFAKYQKFSLKLWKHIIIDTKIYFVSLDCFRKNQDFFQRVRRRNAYEFTQNSQSSPSNSQSFRQFANSHIGTTFEKGSITLQCRRKVYLRRSFSFLRF